MTDYYSDIADSARNQPGLSIADGRFIDKWEHNSRLREENRVKGQVQARRAKDAAKLREVRSRISDLRGDFAAVRRAAERNEKSPVELAKELNRLNSQRVRLEQMAASLEQAEQTNLAMLADPVAYMTGFFYRFPTLKVRRPDLAADLAEDRYRRGRK